MKILKLSVILGLLTTLNGASFDCKKATSFMEHTICNDKELSKLDEELAKSYKIAKMKADQEVLKQEQRVWIETSQKSCQNADCLKKVYKQRIYELNNYESNQDININGNYISKNDPDGSIEIVMISPVKFQFAIDAVSFNGNMCSAEGMAYINLKNNHAQSFDKRINMKFSKNFKTIEIDTVDSTEFCGLNAYMNGTYKKR